VGRDGETYAGDLGQMGMRIFLKQGLDRQITFFVMAGLRRDRDVGISIFVIPGREPLPASPESITTTGIMDSWPAPSGASSDEQLRIGE
jgi:hypothetical protein